MRAGDRRPRRRDRRLRRPFRTGAVGPVGFTLTAAIVRGGRLGAPRRFTVRRWRFPPVLSPAVISSAVSRVSAAVLLVAGVALLFGADALLPMLAPGFPPAAAWLGQLLAAAWLGVAALNWLHRGALLGGIYGRPVVFANVVLYFVSALSVLRALPGGGPRLWLVAGPAAALAVAYGVLLFRGPFDPLPGAAPAA